jgi:16S rRNA (guanine966-N2)-methyltransferase
MADAGRVIAGSARSIRLDAPGVGTRPMADRVKQTLFGILEPDLPRARVLDLFAGSGAGGIEALSRGATHATFVERDARAIRTIRANLERTGLAAADRATVVRADVLTWLRDPARASEARYDVALVDPPYDDTAALTAALEDVGRHVAATGRVVAKHFWRTPPPVTVGLLASERERRFGDTALTFYRLRDPRGSAADDASTEDG